MSTRDDDAALLRAIRGAKFGPNARVTLPTGETMTGGEVALWADVEQSDPRAHGNDTELLAINTLLAKGADRSVALAKVIADGRDRRQRTTCIPMADNASWWNRLWRNALPKPRRYYPNDGDKVWYRDIGGPYGDDHWHWGLVSRPTQPDRRTYYVRIEGDPMRSRAVAAEDLMPYDRVSR